MVDIDATTPQFKAIMVMRDSFNARDLRDFEALLSKDWVFTTHPKVPELPEVRKEEYLRLYKTFFSSFTKVEVYVHHLESLSNQQTDVSRPTVHYP